MDAPLNRLVESVLTSTHNLYYLEQKLEMKVYPNCFKYKWGVSGSYPDVHSARRGYSYIKAVRVCAAVKPTHLFF